MGKSETPIKDKTPSAYESGAVLAQPAEKLDRHEGYSTADYALQRSREEAHREALTSEQRHHDQIHPFVKPKPKW